MQFTVFALLSLVAVAFAAPIAQSTQAQPNGEAAAMSTQAGTVVGFDATQVYKAASNGA